MEQKSVNCAVSTSSNLSVRQESAQTIKSCLKKKTRSTHNSFSYTADSFA